MNWFDFVLLGILAVGAFMGMRIGLIGAAFTVAGVLIGWLLAGQYSGQVGEVFGDSLSNDTIVTVLSYGIIIVVAVVVSRIVAKVVKPLLTVFTLGLSSLVDRLGGLALGLVLGAAISGALVLAAARVTYNFELSDITDRVSALGDVAEQIDQVADIGEQIDQVVDIGEQIDKVVEIGEQFAKVEDVRAGLETALSDSQIVSAFISVTDALPANALGFVPADFSVALELLKENTE